ncbi:hypothetical protein [Kutzneria kofuensis]|uniref:Uncharacterized protein n=1 Tax=Kutzneria kofuensis TaxID=103725 RepID=A0A7W9KH54_9PSEU|nr:hypothetical protein [Kutzneria kofuensis]MBB5892517.1 hypothetical protein [Kutzneria kofuensis]
MDLDDELRKLFADDRLDVPVRPEADRVIVTGARRVRRRRAGVVFGGGMLSVATMLVAGTAFGVSGDAPQRTPLAAAESSGLTTTTTPPPSSTTTTDAPRTTVVPPPATTEEPTHTTATSTTTTSSSTPTKAKPPANPLAFGPTTVGPLRLGMTVDEAEATGLIQANSEPQNAAGCLGYDWAGHPAAGYHYSLVFSPKYGLVRIGGRTNAETPEGIYDGSSEDDVRAVYPDQSKPHIGHDEWVTPVPGNPSAHYWLTLRNHLVTDIRLELASQDCYQ